jgi:NAD(P)-dependent dehydrogenase (short-subunit alcohol dehydrogenase family)
VNALYGKWAVVIGGTGRLGPLWRDALSQAGATVNTFSQPWWDINDGAIPSPGDILVINAGVDDRPGSAEPWPKYDTARAMCDVNLLGAYRMLVEVGGKMKPGSSIILIASLYGLTSPDLRYYDHRPDHWMKSAMYGATKAGVISMVRYFAALYGPRGVRVNALAPGGVVDPADTLTTGDAEFQRKYTERIPMGRMCQPSDLGGPLVFLASDASSFITGHTIPIDGGFLCW